MAEFKITRYYDNGAVYRAEVIKATDYNDAYVYCMSCGYTHFSITIPEKEAK